MIAENVASDAVIIFLATAEGNDLGSLCLYDCFGSPGGSLPRSFRLTCCARDLSAGCSCPFSSNTMPCCAALRSGFGMPAWPPCLPPISCGPSKSLAFDISTSRCGSGALTFDQGFTLLTRYGEPSLSYWKTAPAAGQRLEPSFHRMRYGGIATPGRSYQVRRSAFVPPVFLPWEPMDSDRPEQSLTVHLVTGGAHLCSIL